MGDWKQQWSFWPKTTPVHPKCLGRHKDCPDCPLCNDSFLWDKSEPTQYTRDQHRQLLNKNGQVLCLDFQQPCGCSSKGHNHECSGCSNPNHGAQDCPHHQQTSGMATK
ncbi:hypothetical protein V8B97DRAFT_1940266 [Scleroderma yunnanense]